MAGDAISGWIQQTATVASWPVTTPRLDLEGFLNGKAPAEGLPLPGNFLDLLAEQPAERPPLGRQSLPGAPEREKTRAAVVPSQSPAAPVQTRKTGRPQLIARDSQSLAQGAVLGKTKQQASVLVDALNTPRQASPAVQPELAAVPMRKPLPATSASTPSETPAPVAQSQSAKVAQSPDPPKPAHASTLSTSMPPQDASQPALGDKPTQSVTARVIAPTTSVQEQATAKAVQGATEPAVLATTDRLSAPNPFPKPDVAHGTSIAALGSSSQPPSKPERVQLPGKPEVVVSPFVSSELPLPKPGNNQRSQTYILSAAPASGLLPQTVEPEALPQAKSQDRPPLQSQAKAQLPAKPGQETADTSPRTGRNPQVHPSDSKERAVARDGAPQAFATHSPHPTPRFSAEQNAPELPPAFRETARSVVPPSMPSQGRVEALPDAATSQFADLRPAESPRRAPEAFNASENPAEREVYRTPQATPPDSHPIAEQEAPLLTPRVQPAPTPIDFVAEQKQVSSAGPISGQSISSHQEKAEIFAGSKVNQGGPRYTPKHSEQTPHFAQEGLNETPPAQVADQISAPAIPNFEAETVYREANHTPIQQAAVRGLSGSPRHADITPVTPRQLDSEGRSPLPIKGRAQSSRQPRQEAASGPVEPDRLPPISSSASPERSTTRDRELPESLPQPRPAVPIAHAEAPSEPLPESRELDKTSTAPGVPRQNETEALPKTAPRQVTDADLSVAAKSPVPAPDAFISQDKPVESMADRVEQAPRLQGRPIAESQAPVPMPRVQPMPAPIDTEVLQSQAPSGAPLSGQATALPREAPAVTPDESALRQVDHRHNPKLSHSMPPLDNEGPIEALPRQGGDSATEPEINQHHETEALNPALDGAALPPAASPDPSDFTIESDRVAPLIPRQPDAEGRSPLPPQGKGQSPEKPRQEAAGMPAQTDRDPTMAPSESQEVAVENDRGPKAFALEQPLPQEPIFAGPLVPELKPEFSAATQPVTPPSVLPQGRAEPISDVALRQEVDAMPAPAAKPEVPAPDAFMPQDNPVERGAADFAQPIPSAPSPISNRQNPITAATVEADLPPISQGVEQAPAPAAVPVSERVRPVFPEAPVAAPAEPILSDGAPIDGQSQAPRISTPGDAGAIATPPIPVDDSASDPAINQPRESEPVSRAVVDVSLPPAAIPEAPDAPIRSEDSPATPRQPEPAVIALSPDKPRQEETNSPAEPDQNPPAPVTDSPEVAVESNLDPADPQQPALADPIFTEQPAPDSEPASRESIHPASPPRVPPQDQSEPIGDAAPRSVADLSPAAEQKVPADNASMHQGNPVQRVVEGIEQPTPPQALPIAEQQVPISTPRMQPEPAQIDPVGEQTPASAPAPVSDHTAATLQERQADHADQPQQPEKALPAGSPDEPVREAPAAQTVDTAPDRAIKQPHEAETVDHAAGNVPLPQAASPEPLDAPSQPHVAPATPRQPESESKGRVPSPDKPRQEEAGAFVEPDRHAAVPVTDSPEVAVARELDTASTPQQPAQADPIFTEQPAPDPEPVSREPAQTVTPASVPPQNQTQPLPDRAPREAVDPAAVAPSAPHTPAQASTPPQNMQTEGANDDMEHARVSVASEGDVEPELSEAAEAPARGEVESPNAEADSEQPEATADAVFFAEPVASESPEDEVEHDFGITLPNEHQPESRQAEQTEAPVDHVLAGSALPRSETPAVPLAAEKTTREQPAADRSVAERLPAALHQRQGISQPAAEAATTSRDIKPTVQRSDAVHREAPVEPQAFRSPVRTPEPVATEPAPKAAMRQVMPETQQPVESEPRVVEANMRREWQVSLRDARDWRVAWVAPTAEVAKAANQPAQPANTPVPLATQAESAPVAARAQADSGDPSGREKPSDERRGSKTRELEKAGRGGEEAPVRAFPAFRGMPSVQMVARESFSRMFAAIERLQSQRGSESADRVQLNVDLENGQKLRILLKYQKGHLRTMFVTESDGLRLAVREVWDSLQRQLAARGIQADMPEFGQTSDQSGSEHERQERWQSFFEERSTGLASGMGGITRLHASPETAVTAETPAPVTWPGSNARHVLSRYA